MKNHILICISALLLICFPLRAQINETANVHLSQSAYASLLTCGPGMEFYTTFGHTALRVCDSTQGIDVVYNYGTFNFDEPHFYLHFAQGKLNYFLARSGFQNFMMEYAFEGRSVFEQRLLLTNKEVNRLFRLLETNYLPQNKYYLYDYFADNCATRVRDMIDSALIGRSLFSTPSALATQPTAFKKGVNTKDNLSFRRMVMQYTQPNLLWWQLGIDLLLGARCDKPVSSFDYMFAPNDLRYQLDSGYTTWKKGIGSDSTSLSLVDSGSTFFVDTASGTLRNSLPIVAKEKQLLRESNGPMHKSFSPVLAFWLLNVVVLIADLLSMAKQRRNYDKGSKLKNTYRLNWLDGILFGAVGLLSLLLLFMWFGTNHFWTKANWNLLWANPLFLVLLCRLRKNNRVVAGIILACLLVTACLGCTGVLPQQLNTAILPICILLIARMLYRLRKN